MVTFNSNSETLLGTKAWPSSFVFQLNVTASFTCEANCFSVQENPSLKFTVRYIQKNKYLQIKLFVLQYCRKDLKS